MPFRFAISDIIGLDSLLRKFEKFADDGLRDEMRQSTEKAVQYVHSRIPPYPPPPAGSTYRRTGDLGRSIKGKVEPISTGFVGSIGTNKVYAPFVIDRHNQARVHRGRWWTLQEVIEKARQKIVGFYVEGVKRYWSRR